jgi:hypothetical protein
VDVKTVGTAVVVVALALALVSFAWAGIEPSPFAPGTNVLNSVVNVLGEVDGHLLGVVSRLQANEPPDPCINQLNALTKQLQKQNGRVEAVLDMVSGRGEPPDDFVGALQAVGDAAYGDPRLVGLGVALDTGFTLDDRDSPPDTTDEVVQARYRVFSAAMDIVDAVNGSGFLLLGTND